MPPQVGSWIKLPTAASLEAVVAAGADFVCIDMCNGWLSVERVAELLSVRSGRCRRLVRLAQGASVDVAGQLLDAGADGLVLAHATSAESIRAWVDATRFPPDGTRGMGSTGRAGRWGLGSREAYLGVRPGVAVMIEDRSAVEQLDEIAAVSGVDQLVVGTADLGMSYDDDHNGFRDAVDAVAAACAAHALSAAVAVGSADGSADLLTRGYDTLYLSNDVTLLARAAAREFRAARGG